MAEDVLDRPGIAARGRLIATLIAAVLSVAGCKSTTPAAAPSPDPSSSAVSNPSSPAPAPAPAPVSTSPQQTSNQAPAQASNPEPLPPPARPPVPLPLPPVTAPAGTRIVVRTNETLSASHNDVGDRFTGELAQPIISRGNTVFPRGTRVEGSVVASKKRGRFKGAGDLGIEINSIGGVHVQTSEYEQSQKGKGKRTGGFIGGGAGLGALIGGLAGGGKGAVIGGLAGAGAGTAGAAYTGNKDVIIHSETLVSFNLAAPLTVERRAVP